MNQEEILQQGYLIIHKIDIDNHGYIEIEEFIRAYINHRLFTSNNQIKVVFDFFDTDKENSSSMIQN
jgi:Ca2+-binding EF-hand superfamily protein